MVNYLLADMVCRLKNAAKLFFNDVLILQNRISYFSLFSLIDLGYVRSYHWFNFKFIKVYMFYRSKLSIIHQINIISRPSSRCYLRFWNFKGTRWHNFHINGLFMFCSTSYKILTSTECCILHIGGEPVFMTV